MKKRNEKALFVALVLVCLSSMSALAAGSGCSHIYEQVGVEMVGHWNTTHYVAGPNGAEVCNVLHEVVRYYVRCSKCGDQMTREQESEYHSSTHCSEGK